MPCYRKDDRAMRPIYKLFRPNPVSVPLHQIALVGVSVGRDLKIGLFGREIIFEVFQIVWKTYLDVTDGQTDWQTDDIQSHNRALRIASRGKTERDIVITLY